MDVVIDVKTKSGDLSYGVYTLEVFENHLKDIGDEKLISNMKDAMLYCATGSKPVGSYLISDNKVNRKNTLDNIFKNSPAFKFVHAGDNFYYLINIRAAVNKIYENRNLFPAEALMFPEEWVVNFFKKHGNQIDKPATTFASLNLVRKLILLGIPHSSAINTVIFKYVRSKIQSNVDQFTDQEIVDINQFMHKQIDHDKIPESEYLRIVDLIKLRVDLNDDELWLLESAYKINKDRDYYVFHNEDRSYDESQREYIKGIKKLYREKIKV